MGAERIRWWLPAAALTAALLAPAPASPGDIAVIAHASVPVAGLSFAELRQIFLGDRQYWASSLKVTLLVRGPSTREREVLLKNVYQMSEAQYRQYWIGKVFRAEAASQPRVVNSAEEAAEAVASTPGAIAFIDIDRAPKGAKVLKLDGRSPGEAAYRLK
jgi:ABC-type phosphate transport system substrate-binding protein